MMRRVAIQRGTVPMRRTGRLRPGKQTAFNLASNARLKIRFGALSIESCELGYKNCTRDNFLTWAHGCKRRKLIGDELDTLVILACQNCHNAIEFLPPAEMLAIVEGVIARRVTS